MDTVTSISPPSKHPSYAIGIDLGTTNTCAAVFIDGKYHIIRNCYDKPTTPSCVAFANDEVLIGEAALQYILVKPENVIFEAKRLIGRKLTDPYVKDYINRWSFNVANSTNNNPVYRIKFKEMDLKLKPQQISAIILKRIKQDAERMLGCKVDKAVITIPAHFNDCQRIATIEAAKIAGLEVLRLLNEPTAASIAYGLNEGDGSEEKDDFVLVVDLGGGTYDVSMLYIMDHTHEVCATAGDSHFGGTDFDEKLTNEIAALFKLNVTENASYWNVRSRCEELKKKLSSCDETTFILSQSEINAMPDKLNSVISRAMFDMWCKELHGKMVEPISKVIRDAKVINSTLKHIVLVGGSSRLPMMETIIKSKFPNARMHNEIDPDLAVAYGAAAQAALLQNRSNRPDGLAEFNLLDSVPMSLGVAIVGRVTENVIRRNYRIPTFGEAVVLTCEDNQPNMYIEIFEGEVSFCSMKKCIGAFTLDLPEGRKGEVRVKIRLDINEDGVVQVTTTILSTGETVVKEINARPDKISEQKLSRMSKQLTRVFNI